MTTFVLERANGVLHIDAVSVGADETVVYALCGATELSRPNAKMHNIVKRSSTRTQAQSDTSGDDAICGKCRAILEGKML